MTRLTPGIYYSTPHNPSTPHPILSSHLHTSLVDLTATHTLTQIFCNPRPHTSTPSPIISATYTFPIYESSAITSFNALLGSTLIHGIIKPKPLASATYTAALASGTQAALLTHSTSEIFTTSIGNIAPGDLVTVVISYVHELKQDLEVDGVRLVIPTVIAPKYGWTDPESSLYKKGWSTGWNTVSEKLARYGAVATDPGMAIEVVVTMCGAVKGVQSPSHPISVTIGSHDVSADEFDPKKARATLGVDAASLTGLDKDFSLIITSADIASPRAFLARHPTREDTAALMVTLAPRFLLPQQRPEVVFVVDRSGSMWDKISTVRSALHLFLASIRVGTYFNICSFGDQYSFLWGASREYSAGTLEEAKRYVDAMDSGMGGTQMLAPCRGVVERRRGGKMEVLVLTDGEIWDTASLFEYISGATSDGDVRFFSLGVGESVSHLLIEGISRAGKGYSQIVGKGENMQRKVMRMLKAALTPHVNDWSVTWEGKPAPADAMQVDPITNDPISVFDPSSNPDDPPSPSYTLPPRPPVLQTPSAIPPLYPYNRTTLYYLITTPALPPSTITLTGTAHDTATNSFHPLSTSIPVQPITSPTTALGLHSLLGRKLLQDLEESHCSYLPPNPAPELITLEGESLGVLFNLASKWTSFVAVAIPDTPPRRQSQRLVLRHPPAPINEFVSPPTPPPLVAATTIGGAGIGIRRRVWGSTGGKAPRMQIASKAARMSAPTTAPKKTRTKQSARRATGGMVLRRQCMAKTGRTVAAADTNLAMDEDVVEKVVVEEQSDMGTVAWLSRLQLFSGLFAMSERLMKVLGLSMEKVEEARKRLGVQGEEKECAFATVVVLAYLEGRLKECEEEWELMAEKARGCLEGLESGDVESMRVEAEGLIA